MSRALEHQRSVNSLGVESGRSMAISRMTRRSLAALEEQTLMRMAVARADGLVASAQMQEVDHLARTAMSGQAMLRRWADTLAAGDPFVADELKFFTDIARMGKGEIIADTIDSYSQEGRRYHR